ncbi:hypothetical protein K438DRAFT_1775908 [Mycena galopus ATCC 62051]|nr:hypothetical protein K438DRAFT_1775908 [Mycena galopus ATCC 62051]
MPLFGSSANDNKLQKRNDFNDAGYSTGTGTGVGGVNDTYGTAMNDPNMGGGMGSGMGGGMSEPGMGNSTTMGGRHHGMHNDGMMATSNTARALAPAWEWANQTHSGGGAMTGKIEHAVGSIIGSKSLKAKGIQKEQEARGLKIQSQELAEAERLEQEAGMRRERAVAHGAHPDNRHVGGHGPPVVLLLAALAHTTESV